MYVVAGNVILLLESRYNPPLVYIYYILSNITNHLPTKLLHKKSIIDLIPSIGLLKILVFVSILDQTIGLSGELTFQKSGRTSN